MTFAMLSPTSSALPFNYPNIIIEGGQTGIDLLRGLGEKGQRAAAQLGVTRKQAEVKKAKANDDYCKQALSRFSPYHPNYPQLKLKAVEAEADLQAAQGELDAATKALDLLKSAGGAVHRRLDAGVQNCRRPLPVGDTDQPHHRQQRLRDPHQPHQAHSRRP